MMALSRFDPGGLALAFSQSGRCREFGLFRAGR